MLVLIISCKEYKFWKVNHPPFFDQLSHQSVTNLVERKWNQRVTNSHTLLQRFVLNINIVLFVKSQWAHAWVGVWVAVEYISHSKYTVYSIQCAIADLSKGGREGLLRGTSLRGILAPGDVTVWWSLCLCLCHIVSVLHLLLHYAAQFNLMQFNSTQIK